MEKIEGMAQMAKDKSGAKWIERSLVLSPSYIGLCRSEGQLKRELKRIKVKKGNWPDRWVTKGKDASVHKYDNHRGKSLCLVCIDDSGAGSPNEIVGLLIHEAVHVWQMIRDKIRECPPGAEFEAYTIQTIAQRLIIAYSEMRKAKKRKKG